MSTKREPLLSNEALEFLLTNHTPEKIRDILALYEWARAKDAELIQALVDQVEACRVELCSAIPHLPRIGVKLATAREAECRSVLEAAATAGFKPSKP